MDEAVVEKIQSFYSEANALEERLMFIDEQLRELDSFKKQLGLLDNIQNNEILASVGKGIFMKSVIQKSEFFIDVGAGVVLPKTCSEIISTIEQQIGKLGEMRQQSLAYFLEINKELEALVQNAKHTHN